MTKRIQTARIIIENTRINEYARSLQFAQDQGYQIGGVADFHLSDKQGRRLILRHDVDLPEIGIREMLAVESELAISATWYFRWSSYDDPLMRTILAAGGEIGLHYETLATVLEQKGIKAQADVSSAIIEEAQNTLRREIGQFREKIGLSTLTIASHGHPINQAIRISNNVLATEEFCQSAGVMVEAYSPRILNHISCYVSDTNLLINQGWAYNQSLIQAIKAGHRTICFLSHPNHWHYTWITKLADITKLALRGLKQQPRSFRPQYDS